jgi:hypothetical protein
LVKPSKPGPNGDPFRSYLIRALKALLRQARKSEEQWEMFRAERRQDHLEFVESLQRINLSLETNTAALREGSALTVAALGQVGESLLQTGLQTRDALREVTEQLRRLRPESPSS